MRRGVSPRGVDGLDLAILGLLRPHPNHAYGLYRDFENAGALNELWHITHPQLYARVAKLEAEGYVASTLEPQGAKPPKKTLHLTDAGHTAFAEWLESPIAHGLDFRQAFLAKLYFVTMNGAAPITRLITRQRAACQTWLADFELARANVADDQVFRRMALEFWIGQIEAILTWLDTCEQALAT
jgi:PadR family transcriptional regulator, regulatory protein AphA